MSFGGGRSSNPQPVAVQTSSGQSSSIPEEFKPYFTRLFSGAEAASQQVPTSYTGPLLPAPNQFSNESLGATESAARSITGTGSPLIQLGRDVTAGRYLDPNSNPFFQSAMRAAIDPVTQSFTNTILPAIQSRAVQEGAYGGAREDLAKSQASSELTRNLLNITMPMAFQEVNRREQQQLQGPDIMRAGISQELFPYQLLEAVGEQRRAQEAEQIGEQLARFQERVVGPFRPIEPLAQIIRGTNVGTNVTGTSNVANQFDAGPGVVSRLFAGGLGGALAGGVLGNMFGADSMFGSLGTTLRASEKFAPGVGGAALGLPLGLLLGGLM